VYEERPLFLGKPLEELARPDLWSFKAIELSHRPGDKRLMTCRSKGYSADGALPSVVLDQPRRSGLSCGQWPAKTAVFDGEASIPESSTAMAFIAEELTCGN